MTVVINGTTGIDTGTGSLVAADSTTATYLDMFEDTDNGSNYVRLIAPASIAANRTLTLPNNTGTLLSTASTGTVLQVVSTALTSATSYSVGSGATQAITGLSASITPSSASSKVMVFVTANISSGNVGPAIILLRGATPIGVGDAAGSRTQVNSGSNASAQTLYSEMQAVTIQYLDSPSTTGSTTYSVNLLCTRASTDTIYVNRSITDTSASNFGRYMSSITLMEIAG